MSLSQANYDKNKMTSFHLKFHNLNDQDVIDRIKSVDNKNDYIRRLVRKDIEEDKDGKATTDDTITDDG